MEKKWGEKHQSFKTIIVFNKKYFSSLFNFRHCDVTSPSLIFHLLLNGRGSRKKILFSVFFFIHFCDVVIMTIICKTI